MFLKSLLLYLFIFLPFTPLKGENSISISDFLNSSKEHYEQILTEPQNSETVHFVMGNESADLDSVISSIAYAYLLNQKEVEHGELFIPLINIYREEIALRKDILYLFQLMDISVDNLLFLDDDIPLNTWLDQDRVRLNLVDHNVLRPRQEHLFKIVERIIDHHVDENIHYPLMRAEDKLMAEVGSNTTLVAELLFKDKILISPKFAAFLLAPILIDTSNLTSVEKTTTRDIRAVEALEILASHELPMDFYQTLSMAKNDVSGLTPKMLLSKDFKEYLDGEILYGISSLPPTVQWHLEDFELISQDIQKYASEKNLAYLILFLSSNEPLIKRRVFVYSPSIDLLDAFDTYVQTDEVLNNLLIPVLFEKELQICSYKTEKPLARKQFQPLLHFSENQDIKTAFENFTRGE